MMMMLISVIQSLKQHYYYYYYYYYYDYYYEEEEEEEELEEEEEEEEGRREKQSSNVCWPEALCLWTYTINMTKIFNRVKGVLLPSHLAHVMTSLSCFGKYWYFYSFLVFNNRFNWYFFTKTSRITNFSDLKGLI